VFEIGFGGELGEFVGWELAAQKAAELFTKVEPGGAEGKAFVARAALVDQLERAGWFAEAGNFEREAAAGFALDGGDAADQVAVLIPGLELGAAVAQLDGEIFGSDEEALFARFGQDGLEAGVQEALDGGDDFPSWGLGHECI